MGKGNGGRGLRGGLQQTGGDVIRPAAVGRWARQRRQKQLHNGMGWGMGTSPARSEIAGYLSLAAPHPPWRLGASLGGSRCQKKSNLPIIPFKHSATTHPGSRASPPAVAACPGPPQRA